MEIIEFLSQTGKQVVVAKVFTPSCCHDETLLESDGLSKIQHLSGLHPIGALTKNILNVWSLTVRQAIRE